MSEKDQSYVLRPSRPKTRKVPFVSAVKGKPIQPCFLGERVCNVSFGRFCQSRL